jgi:hypothetical protein
VKSQCRHNDQATRQAANPPTRNIALTKILVFPGQFFSSQSQTHKAATMPTEVSDIKQFIEICRRKDASCESTNCSLVSATELEGSFD